MNWDQPPKWNTPNWTSQSVDQTKKELESYIAKLKEEGKEGWVCIPATALYKACSTTISPTLFGRHLKELNVPKKHTKTSHIYNLFVPSTN